jgi:hypothetical protein
LLLSALGLLGAACASGTTPTRTPAGVETPAPGSVDVAPWNQEARAILTAVLAALRTFDDFHAFRATHADESSIRLAAELVWDPPTGQAWDDATRTARSVQPRANQLFTTIRSTPFSEAEWRQQREMADAAHELVDLADMLAAYRDVVDTLGNGDASGTVPVLDRAWTKFDTAAERWSFSRSEAIGCG